MITLIEPQRGKNILEWLNHFVSSDPTLFHAVSICADIFVFAYPVILIAMYFYGYVRKKQAFQLAGISILMSWVVAIAINLIIQLFIWKDRPETLAWLKLILSHVPSISFPSDHAAISMAMAVWTFLAFTNLKDLKQKHTWVNGFSFMLLAFSLIMGVCRIAVAIHRPTDILAWWIIGIIWWRIGRKLSYSTIGTKLTNWIIWVSNNIINWILPAKFRS